MPRHFLPRKSGAHRIACIALYRAILSHVARIPLPPNLPSQGQINPVKHVVRKEFRRYVNHSSAGIVVEVLNRGYAAEELFRKAANSDEESLSKVHQFLWKLHARRDAARKVCLPAQPSKPSRPRVWPHPNPERLIVTTDRPLPLEQLTGRRRLPHLASANGIPFLRCKKPQSPFLSRVLRDKANQKQRRTDLLHSLEGQLEIAHEESTWEENVRAALAENEAGDVREQKGSTMAWLNSQAGKEYTEGGWEKVVANAERQVYLAALSESEKWLDRGKVLAVIEEKEKELWKKERAQRIDEHELKKKESRSKRAHTGGERLGIS